MSESIEKLFADAKYCTDEIARIRESIGTLPSTQSKFEAAIKALGFMLLYCPESVRPLAEMQLAETNRRMSYAMFKPGFFES